MSVGTRLGDMGSAEQAAQRAADSKWVERLGRFGLVAKGFSFGLVGVLAIELALGNGGKATSRQGALAQLAGHGYGKVALVLLALGFAGYAIWRFVQGATADADEDAPKKWGKRAGYIGRGAIYAGLTYTTVKLLLGSGQQQSQNGKAHQTTATVLGWPAGTWIVGIAGAIIVGVGLWNGYRGITKKFAERWKTGQMSATARKWGERVGVVGHLARLVVFALIGVFAIKAALDYDPKDAIGLDGALQKLVHQPYGPALLGLTAAGLVAYGVYCLVDARLRDVAANR